VSTVSAAGGSIPRLAMADERVQVLQDFIRARLLVGGQQPLTPQTRLLSEGLVDSMGLVILAAFVEERFGVRIPDADMRTEQLETIDALLALVDRCR
jgi:acyl carrier protein